MFGARWVEVVRRWALGQLQMIDVPLEQRDVYELTAGARAQCSGAACDAASDFFAGGCAVEWASLLRRAGFKVEGHGYVDSHNLFALWRCVCGARP